MGYLILLLLQTFLLLTLCSVLRFVYTFWLRPKSIEKRLRQQGIRGSSYRFFYGDKKLMVKSSLEATSTPISLCHDIRQRVFPFFHQLVQNYGKVALSWLDTDPWLILTDPELMRFVLTNKNDDFGKPVVNHLAGLLHMGITTLDGEEGAKRRKLITPAFHFDKLRSMIPAFSSSCCDLIDRWKERVRPGESCELDVAPEFQMLAGDVIARTAFGSSYKEGKKIFQLQKEQAGLVLEAYYGVYFPGLRFIPTKKNRRRNGIDKELNTILYDMIDRRRRALQVEGNEEDNVDLLGLLLQCQSQSGNKMTTQDIIEECKFFYFAGHETTANWLTWTMVVLSMHPDWQDKARREVLTICGKTKPDIDCINRLKIVSMVLNEVLRLYPPSPTLRRRTLRQTNIGGKSIPSGVHLMLPLLFVHHNPEYWGEDVLEFKPERFAEGVSQASKDQILSFYSFGWGPRFCLGQSFAIIEAKMALAMILQNFWFELSPSYAHAPTLQMTLLPQYGAQIMLHQIEEF